MLTLDCLDLGFSSRLSGPAKYQDQALTAAPGYLATLDPLTAPAYDCESVKSGPKPMSYDIPHPHDISPDNLEFAMNTATRPDLLRILVELSRRAFGFFTRKFHYTINSPWTVTQFEILTAGAKALEIGAGVNPYAAVSGGAGRLCRCVDRSPIIRTPPAGDWNEWGSFDYSLLNSKLTSYHCDVEKFTPRCAYDVIYSICVIAHMPRATREDTFRRCHDWLEPGGTLLLAMDLIPSTDFLWNRGGDSLEPPRMHGTIDDVIRQLSELDFVITEQTVIRNVPRHHRTELLFIACKLVDKI